MSMWYLLAQTDRQKEVFKSISENVGSSADPKVFYSVMLGAAALVLLLVLINTRKKREASPKAVNHHGKLMKEVVRRLPLKGREVKQLRTIATDQGLESPLTLVLCPSLLAKGVNAAKGGRVDKVTVMRIAQKMGVLKRKEPGKKDAA